MKTLSLSEARIKLSGLVEVVRATDEEILITNRVRKDLIEAVAAGSRERINEETALVLRKEEIA